MRLFVAVPLPSPVKDHLVALSHSLDPSLGSFRLVRAEQMHLTLKFLDEQQDADAIGKALAKVGFQRFDLTLGKAGAFPAPQAARVIWAGLCRHEKLWKLQADIEAALAFLRLPKERGGYHPHLTIARVAKVHDSPGLAKRIASLPLESLMFPVAEFCLFESVLGQQGARHTILRRFPAQGL